MFSAYPARSNRAGINNRRTRSTTALPCTSAPKIAGAYVPQSQDKLDAIFDATDAALVELEFFGGAL